jgi:hypothetical protein
VANAILGASSSLLCPHGATATHVPGQVRVRVAGEPVLTASDLGTVAGCTFQITGGAASPCVTVRWIVPASRVRAGGQPVLLESSVATCNSAAQAPQGPPSIVMVQARVKGT